MNAVIKGFYKLPVTERVNIVSKRARLSEKEKKLLSRFSFLGKNRADLMIENVVSSFPLPLGLALNFKVNNVERFVPMAVEESSVVAACSFSAKLARQAYGFRAETSTPLMIGQVFLFDVPNIKKAVAQIKRHEKELIESASNCDKVLSKLGGGLKKIETINLSKKNSLLVHLIVDVRDAMGANTVNTICEKLSPLLESITNGKAVLKILSNLAVHRISNANALYSFEALEESFDFTVQGKKVAKKILRVFECSKLSPFRAVTHNKGIMNGVDAVVIATGNDWRAVESAAHSFACITGRCLPLTSYKLSKNGLLGRISLPLPLGVVGGITRVHPMAQLSLKLLRVKTASELCNVIASVGLAQNFAALRALAVEGIQKGHMKLHAENIAVQAGAKGNLIKKVALLMIEKERVNQLEAKKILRSLKK